MDAQVQNEAGSSSSSNLNIASESVAAPPPPLSSSTTSKRALPFHSIPHILDEICECLAYDDELDPFNAKDAATIARSRRNLLHVALASTTLLEPALDRLWRNLDSLFPLLKILPAFIKSDGTYVLRGAISDVEWERFDWYARRVRRFSYSRDPDALDIAMHVYFRLAQLHKPPILPSLRYLHCPSTSQRDFLISGICLFLSPSLEALEFNGISNVEDKLCGTMLHTLFCDGAEMEKIILIGRGLSLDTSRWWQSSSI
ncbi:hypothetical protein CPB84DRAFT_1844591 [Gymnopilus junonius]|uniref:Uncharacterized protein n=1 Tax=Gymnopilus junonius TaxID=109634 RepID=A0A9P5NRC5_GYMJU|nr:hypothetical protein CPB84DRAFT_1844591 [Gymnopilus junonius]